ncbi:MAG: hypothetical protein RR949_06890, partial [Oscillospiraceae bacterium]
MKGDVLNPAMRIAAGGPVLQGANVHFAAEIGLEINILESNIRYQWAPTAGLNSDGLPAATLAGLSKGTAAYRVTGIATQTLSCTATTSIIVSKEVKIALKLNSDDTTPGVAKPWVNCPRK